MLVESISLPFKIVHIEASPRHPSSTLSETRRNLQYRLRVTFYRVIPTSQGHPHQSRDVLVEVIIVRFRTPAQVRKFYTDGQILRAFEKMNHDRYGG
jgi:hypothetical protein